MDEIILTLKKFFKPVVWEALDIYEQNFTSRSRKAKRLNEAVKTGRIYFTAKINTNGFTDQIARLVFFYKVGKSLGLFYHHTPLQSDRSLPVDPGQKSEMYPDIYSFTGLNRYFGSLSNEVPEECNHIVVDLDRMQFERRSGTSFRNFIFFLKHRIWDHISGEKNVIIHFRGSENVFHYYRLIAPVSSRLDLRKAYFQYRQENPWYSVFSKNKIKLLIHIRQGDTAIIKTSWNRYIGTSYKIQNRYKEAISKEAVGDHEVVDVKIYYKFLKELFGEFKNHEFSSVMFSDGFNRAFDSIIEHMETVSPENPKIRELKKQQAEYNKIKFKDFLNWDDVETYVGEQNEYLYSLVHAFFESDIIIFGSQAKFIPKMTAIYTNPENMPYLIFLYKIKHPHVDYLGIDHDTERLLFVDIQNYDITRIANKIKQYLLTRK